MKSLTSEEVRALSDQALDDLAWRVQAEQARRRKLWQPRSVVEDIRQSLTDQAQRRLINAKGPFHCSCPDRSFDDIDAYMEHCRVLHKDGR